ncbi:STAS domain-containing protein [Streptomyces virginiae]
MISPSDRLAVAVERWPERTRVRVSGEIDMEDAAEVREHLAAALDAAPGGLDVDLAGVTFCDSSGLHVLLDLNQQALEAGKTLVLTALSRTVVRLLHITGTRGVLTVEDLPASDARHPVTRSGVDGTGPGSP